MLLFFSSLCFVLFCFVLFSQSHLDGFFFLFRGAACEPVHFVTVFIACSFDTLIILSCKESGGTK